MKPANKLNIQLMSSNLVIGLEILLAGPVGDLHRQGGRRRLFVPANFFQIIADILFVVGLLSASRRVFVGWPEARGIRREYLIGQRDSLGRASKFELGVGDDDTALPCKCGSFLVNPQ